MTALPTEPDRRKSGTMLRLKPMSAWGRDIRLGSGLVLMTFVTTHLLNHALGILGLETMKAVQDWRYAVWHSWPGTVVLYAAFVAHPFFGLLRVAQRHTLRMPMRELFQILLGLAIPILLVNHIVNTRVMGAFFHVDESYPAVLGRMWPDAALTQSLLLLLVWFHGVIGLHFVLRTRDWYERWRDVGLVVAVLVPVLALIGFFVAGREAVLAATPEPVGSDAQMAMNRSSVMWAKSTFYGLVGAFAAYVAGREIYLRTARTITVRFVGHGARRVFPGATLLEISRRFGIPHASLCGGRARCATCRVVVLDGEQHLPPPGPNEDKMLRRIAAAPRTRLACQVRPQQDLQVQILLASDRIGGADLAALRRDDQASRTELTALVADLRAFSALSARHGPNELMSLLNRFYDEMTQAVQAHGGRIEAVYGDGLMAIFGLHGRARTASRSAIAAAGDMLHALEALNREYTSLLPLPLRIGIGIHTGSAVMGAVQNEGLGRRDVTVGETVMVASQLEAATRRLLADLVISNETIVATGRQYRGGVPHRLPIKGRDEPILAHAFVSAPEFASGPQPEEPPDQAKEEAI